MATPAFSNVQLELLKLYSQICQIKTCRNLEISWQVFLLKNLLSQPMKFGIRKDIRKQIWIPF